MAITNLQVQQAKPGDKPYKLADGKGLHLYITPKGQKYWRLNYRYGGKHKTLALGVYPEVSLAEAREKQEKARHQLKNDIDPAEVKRAEKLAKTEAQQNSFEAIALEWFEKERPHWSDKYAERVNSRLQKYLIPHVGRLPVNSITAPNLLACLRRVESRGAIDTAHRVKQIAGQVFRYAVATGR